MSSSGTPSILVVDDDPVHTNVVFHILRASGYHVESCDDAVDAIEALRWKSYTVIILDLMMEVFSGERLLDFVEKNMPWLAARIIILTGMPGARTVLQGRQIFGVIEKPFKQRDLLSLVSRCVAQPAPPPAPPAHRTA